MDVLANWLWQGGAVAMAAAGLLRLSPRSTATTRHRVWWIALGLVLALPFVPGLGSATGATTAPVMAVATPSRSLSVVLPSPPVWAVAIVLTAWMCWLGVSGVRLAIALLALRRAKRSSRPFPSRREIRLQTWMRIRDASRPVRLVVSDDVHSAAVLGLGAPAIAVAPVVARELTDAELDRILVHEWAHLLRRDDVGRLIQLIVMALAGLHPAVWWIDRRLHLERETACDDWAVNITGSARDYAACLTKLAALQSRAVNTVLIPAAWSSSAFSTRIVRLLDRGRNTATERKLPSLACMSVLLAATTMIAAGFELVVTKPLAMDVPAAASAIISGPPPVSFTPATMVETGDAAASMPRRASEPRRTASPRIAAAPPASNPPAEPVPPPGAPEGIPETTLPTPSFTLTTALPESLATVPVGPAPSTVGESAAIGSVTPWGAAADASVSIGRGSQKAAVATAGFFSRLGKSIASAF